MPYDQIEPLAPGRAPTIVGPAHFEGLMVEPGPDEVEPKAATDLESVRLDGSVLRKGEGAIAIGAPASNRVVALGEYKFGLTDLIFQRFVRVLYVDGRAALEIWDGNEWDRVATSEELVGDQLFSMWSTQGALVFATGKNILIYEENVVLNESIEVFPGDTILLQLDALHQSGPDMELTATANVERAVTTPLVKLSSIASSDTDFDLDIVIHVNGVEDTRITFEHRGLTNPDASHVGVLEIPIEGELSQGDTIEVLFENPNQISGPNNQQIALLETADPTVDRKGLKVTPGRAGGLTYEFVVHNGFSTDKDFDLWVEFVGVGWEQVGTLVNVPGLGGSDSFDWVAPDPFREISAFGFSIVGGGDPAFAGGEINYAETIDFQVQSFFELSLGITADLHYQYFVESTSALELISEDAPASSYILPFGDRLLAIRTTGNPQLLAASADGLIRVWDGEDTLSTFLLDSRGDPIDQNMAMAVVGESIAALFRQRSIMRLVETGNTQLPIAAIHWLDHVGTEAPHSVRGVRGGVLFLGHDRMVYYLTLQGLTAVGRPIFEEIRDNIGNNENVDATYDPVREEYHLGIPEDGETNISKVYTLDVGEMLDQQVIRWRKRTLSATRLAVVSKV